MSAEDKYIERLKANESKIAGLSAINGLLQEENQILREELQSIKSRNRSEKDKQELIKEFTQRLGQSDLQISNLKAENQRLKSSSQGSTIDECVLEIQELKQQNKQLQEQNKESLQRTQTLEQNNKRNRQQIKQLKNDNEDYAIKTEEYESKVGELNSRINASSDQTELNDERFKKQQQDFLVQIDGQKSLVDSYKHTESKLQIELKECLDKQQDLQIQYNNLETELSQNQKSFEQAQGQFQDRENLLQNQIKSMRGFSDTSGSWKQDPRMGSLETQSDLHSKNEVLSHQLEQVQKFNKQDKEQFLAHIRVLKESLQNKDQIINEVKQQIGDYQRSSQELQQQIYKSQGQITQYEQQARIQAAKINEIAAQCTGYKTENEKMISENVILVKDNNQMQQQIRDLQKLVQNLEVKYNTLKYQILNVEMNESRQKDNKSPDQRQVLDINGTSIDKDTHNSNHNHSYTNNNNNSSNGNNIDIHSHGKPQVLKQDHAQKLLQQYDQSKFTQDNIISFQSPEPQNNSPQLSLTPQNFGSQTKEAIAYKIGHSSNDYLKIKHLQEQVLVLQLQQQSLEDQYISILKDKEQFEEISRSLQEEVATLQKQLNVALEIIGERNEKIDDIEEQLQETKAVFKEQYQILNDKYNLSIDQNLQLQVRPQG